jgi:cytidine deaminase
VGAVLSNAEGEFVAFGLVANSKRPVFPCGACRQVPAEFNLALRIIISTIDGQHETVNLSDLLPRAREGILEFFKDV